MKVIIVTATAGELLPDTKKRLEQHQHPAALELLFRESGVGLLSSAVSLVKMLMQDQPALVIKAGIGGCFDEQVPLGEVMAISNEVIADLGVEESGTWRDLFDLQLVAKDQAPFTDGLLPNELLDQYNLLQLKEVGAVTVNEISTRPERIRLIKTKYQPVVESMEGAALHYVCRLFSTPFIQIRSASNYVGERDKSKWKLKDSIHQLNMVLEKYITQLNEQAHRFSA